MALILTNVGTALLILQHDVRKSGIKSNLCLSYNFLIRQHGVRKGGTNSN